MGWGVQKKQVEVKKDQGRYFFGVDSQKIDRQWWGLVVTPGVLLHLYRAHEAGLLATGGVLECARYLAKQGTRFSVAKAFSFNYRPPRTLPVARDGVATLYDDPTVPSAVYLRYEAERRDFVKSRRGPFALKEGGVMWRLAKEEVTDSEVKRWLQMPVDVGARRYRSPPPDRRQVWVGKTATHNFYEDTLTATEWDIMLGTCRLSFQQYEQDRIVPGFKTVYFWPPPTAWRVSELNTERWSETAEEWYLDRLGKLRRGEAEALSIAEWKHQLPGHRVVRKICNRYNSLADLGKLSSLLVCHPCLMDRSPALQQT